MKKRAAEIIREYGPFEGVDAVHGVTFDGRQVWFASGNRLNALDPAPEGWERRGSSWVWRVRVPANDSLVQTFRQKMKGD